MPPGAGRPPVAPRDLLTHRALGDLELAREEGRDLPDELLEHLEGLGRSVLAPRRGDLAVQRVRREYRPVGVGPPDLGDEVFDLRLPGPKRVGQEPHRQNRVRVDVVDADDGLLVDRQAEADRLADLLAGCPRDQPEASGMVVEGESAADRVDGRALNVAVQGD